MHEGVPCDQDVTLCCYNSAKWCPDGLDSATCVVDNGGEQSRCYALLSCEDASHRVSSCGTEITVLLYYLQTAYPIGDRRSFPTQMTDAHAMAPFPNAIAFNWATLIVLTFGNLGALDFQARCMAAKSAKIATMGCLIAGALCIILGVPFAYLGSIARIYYGPDSTRASYETDVRCTDVLFPFFFDGDGHTSIFRSLKSLPCFLCIPARSPVTLLWGYQPVPFGCPTPTRSSNYSPTRCPHSSVDGV
jgi:hypothetical protein